MRSLFLSVFSGFVLSLCLESAAHNFKFESAAPHANVARTRNRTLVQLDDTSMGGQDIEHTKRGGSSRFTYYLDGLGACGGYNGPNDFIVALNSAQFAGGTHCYQTITITVGGKSTQAQIADECPGCPYLGLDFSKGLFEYFAPTSQGELWGTWDFGDGAPTSTSTPTPSPTTTWTPPPSTTTAWTPTPTTTSYTPTSTSTTVSTTSVASPTSTVVPTPTPPFTPQNPNMLLQLNLALIGLGGLVTGSSS